MLSLFGLLASEGGSTVERARSEALRLERVARARTIVVSAGQSIQQAIDRARPGDTIVVRAGVYRENLVIQKDHITLRGAGAAPGGTVLEPPAKAGRRDCVEFGEVTGICVLGALNKATSAPGRPVTGTRISGFLIRRFSRFGLLLANARDSTICTSVTRHGAQALVS